jgi:hypothetical protein
MSKRPIKSSTPSITPVLPLAPAPGRDVAEVVETRDPRGFVSFQYSYTEVSSHAGRTHVRSTKTQFADGTLIRETFEGELGGDAYREMVDEAQRQMVRSLSRFLPWMPGPRWNRD